MRSRQESNPQLGSQTESKLRTRCRKEIERKSAYPFERVILLVYPPKHMHASVKQYQSRWTSYPGVLALDGRLYFFKEFPVSTRQENRK